MSKYFDYAATCSPIKSSIDSYLEALKVQGSVGRTNQVNSNSQLIEQTRINLNELFNNDGITSFVSSATYAANLIAFSLIKAKTLKVNVYGSVLDHHSLAAPWIKLANEQLINYYQIPLKTDFSFDYEQLTTMWEQHRPDILNLTYVNNVLGYKIELAKICQLFKKLNPDGLIIVDSSQYLGGIDLSKYQIDFCFFSTHKWYSVKGVGCLLISKHGINKFEPLFVGGGGIHKINNQHIYLKSLTKQIEIGTTNEAAIISFKAVLDNLDLSNIRKQNKRYSSYFLSKLKPFSQIKVYNFDTQNQVAFNVENVHNHDFAQLLVDKGFIIRSGNHCASQLMDYLKINGCIRISFGLDTTIESIDELIAAIKQSLLEL